MATDTARVELELASGRNAVTAPFHRTAQRRKSNAAAFASDAPPDASSDSDATAIVDVPLADAGASSAYPNTYLRDTVGPPETAQRRSSLDRPTWIAFLGAIVAVAATVWWVMFQRLPDIDPREVIQRNLADARQAMADKRYTDPSERSALHYYSTVLALDPRNTDAIAGIDAIADRHLTDARVLLTERRIAEAGVALDRARRVRPNHGGLAALDTQLRAELRRILAASNTIPAVSSEPLRSQKTKVADVSSATAKPANLTRATPDSAGAASATPHRSVPRLPNEPFVPKISTAVATNRPAVNAPENLAKAAALLALAPRNASQTSTGLITPVATHPDAAPVDNAPGSGAAVEEPATESATSTSSLVNAPAPTPTVPSVEPKLVKMVQPQYPQEALMRGIEGWVEVSLQVSAAGDVTATRIESTSRGRLFNRAALAAVQQWKYEPRANGQESEVRVRLQFRQSE
jgi:TonB family protein